MGDATAGEARGGLERDGAQSITRNTAFALAGQITAAAFTAALTIYLARTLGPSDFGVFSLAIGFGALIVLPADFGISQSAARFIAERRGDASSVARVMGDALRLKLLVSAVFSVGLLVAAGPLETAYDEDGLAWALRGIALAIFGQSLMMLYGGSFTALARVSLSFRIGISKSVVEMVASVALVVLGAGVTGAAFGRAAGYLCGGLVGAALAVRLLGARVMRKGGEPGGVRRIAGYAGALLIIDGAFVLFEQIDVLLIGALMGAAAAGLFQAPLRLVSFFHYPGYALATGVAPRLARHERHGPRVESFQTALRYLVIFQAALLAPVLVWAQPIVDLVLGSEYSESADVLRALAPYVFLMGLGPLVSISVNYLGEARRRVPIAIGAVAINIAIDAALIPEIGIIAGAIGTDVAYALYVPAHLWICTRLIDISLRPLAITLVRSLLAAGAMSGVLAAFGTSEVSVPLLLVGGLLGCFAFGAVLIAAGEVSRAELAAAAGAASRRLRGEGG